MDKKSSIRIVDIARLANVSVGTVDRVLHNRGKVSEEKRLRVDAVLKEINYEPNMVARFLASKKTFNFAILMPTFEAGEYWELVRAGFDKAEAELRDFNVSIDYFYFNQFDEKSFISVANKVSKEEYSGVVIPTLYKSKVEVLSANLDEKNIPYVFIDSNIQGCNNFAYFGCDSVVSGSISAKLLLLQIGHNGNIAIVNAKNNEQTLSTQIENRKKGFLDYLNTHNYKGTIFNLQTNLDEDNLKNLDTFLTSNASLAAITFNSRIHEIVDFFERKNVTNKIYFVGYDSIGKNVELLQNNKISYLISQRSVQQGYESIKSLSNYLIFNAKHSKDNYMSIDILMKENVEFYHD